MTGLELTKPIEDAANENVYPVPKTSAEFRPWDNWNRRVERATMAYNEFEKTVSIEIDGETHTGTVSIAGRAGDEVMTIRASDGGKKATQLGSMPRAALAEQLLYELVGRRIP